MTPEEHDDRLKWMVWHDTVCRLGDATAQGLTVPQLERVRLDLLPGGAWPQGSVPADLEPTRLRLLDSVCEGLAVLTGGHPPDYPPETADGSLNELLQRTRQSQNNLPPQSAGGA